MRHIAAVTAALLVACIFPASIYALVSPPATLDGGAKQTALNYLLESPTFKFDGVGSTLNVIGVAQSKTAPSSYLVYAEFNSLHGGYGDRTGQLVTDAITPHRIQLTVVNGTVQEAVVDGSWDEVAQRPVNQGGEAVEAIALEWLYACPTFVFDGIRDSVKIVDSWQAETFAYPSFWQVTAEFDSAHPGYGDRSDMMLAQVITHHSIIIHVTVGKVTLAVIDDGWDELAQTKTPNNDVPPLNVVTPEMARNMALKQMMADLGLVMDLPTEWAVEQSTGGVLGHETLIYTSGDWKVTVDYAVVLRPDYAVIVEKGGDSPASWSGTISGQGSVSDGDSGQPEPAPAYIMQGPEARDIAIKYLISIHQGLAYPDPDSWTSKSLVPEGIVGIDKIEYKALNWTIIVSNPVVWKPAYTVEVNYSGTGAFTWVGTITQGGEVTPST